MVRAWYGYRHCVGHGARWRYSFSETILNVSLFWNKCISYSEEETGISLYYHRINGVARRRLWTYYRYGDIRMYIVIPTVATQKLTMNSDMALSSLAEAKDGLCHTGGGAQKSYELSTKISCMWKGIDRQNWIWLGISHWAVAVTMLASVVASPLW